MDGGASPASRSPDLAAGAALAASIADLKRISDARSPDSLATRGFRAAWQRLCAGEACDDVALAITADALVATQLGAVDLSVLRACFLSDPRAALLRGFDAAAASLPEATRMRLRPHTARPPGEHSSGEQWPVRPVAGLPAFVEALAGQPRAGATCPGKPRIMLEPAENHADHCLAVAVLGVALSEYYGADPAGVFLAGLAHHLHNAVLPDSGFAGEILLGAQLAPLMQTLFARETASLPAHLAGPMRAALAVIVDANTPEGRAFHAADVIDRVQQMHHYERVANFRARQALDDLNLVHEGPVQAFHHDVLARAGLW